MTDDPGLTMLLLGVYGMETVECGGVLAKNARAGGRSFASIMLSREASHSHVAFAEAYRREGKFHLLQLMR